MRQDTPKHHIIITAKKGAGKHLWRANGLPLICYPLQAAKEAKTHDTITLWTDCHDMETIAICKHEIETMRRPDWSCTAESPHVDIIRHAIERQQIGPDDVVTVLLGNTVHISGEVIDLCYNAIANDENADSAITAWKAQDDHPFRALSLENGYVRSFGEKPEVGTNRQSYPDVYYYDQGCWTFYARCAFEGNGPKPWIWLGEKCRLVLREWVTGKDVHNELDVKFADAALEMGIDTSGIVVEK